MKPNWLFRQLKSTIKDVGTWPEWMRRESGIENDYRLLKKYVTKPHAPRLVVWKDGSHRYFKDGVTYEYENDPDWLVTISLTDDLKRNR